MVEETQESFVKDKASGEADLGMSLKFFVVTSVVLIVGLALNALAPILTPFLLGALLAYLGDPWVDRLESWGLSRAVSATLVFACIALMLIMGLMLVVPLVSRELSELMRNLPAALIWLQATAAPMIAEWTGLDPLTLDLKSVAQNFLGEWQQSGDLLGYMVGHISASGMALFGGLMTVALTPVVAFYLMRDWDVLVAQIDRLIPTASLSVVRRLCKDGDEMLAAFIRGQFLVMILLGVFYAIGLSFVGIEMAIVIGLVAGLASIVPYLGFVIGLLLAVIAAAYQFQDWMHPGYVLVVFVIGQVLEGSLLTPWLVGDRIGLHPVAVIFAVLAGGQLFGFIGILLALPVAALLMVLVRYGVAVYLQSSFFEASEPNGELSDDSAIASVVSEADPVAEAAQGQTAEGDSLQAEEAPSHPAPEEKPV
ncbi:MAG: AI-2E family transporter [Pseudomonadales bacterium]